MIYVPTTNVQGFIYYIGIFYLKIGKFYTFFHWETQVIGLKIGAGKSLNGADQNLRSYVNFIFRETQTICCNGVKNWLQN